MEDKKLEKLKDYVDKVYFEADSKLNKYIKNWSEEDIADAVIYLKRQDSSVYKHASERLNLKRIVKVWARYNKKRP